MHWDGAERGLSVSVAGKGEDVEKLTYCMPGKLNNRIMIGKMIIKKNLSTIDDDSRSNVTPHRLQQHMLLPSSIHSMNDLYTPVLIPN